MQRPGLAVLLGVAASLVGASVSAQGLWGRPSWTTGDGPSSVVVADLNGDGLPDLATANEIAGTVSVRWGQTSGALELPVSFPVGAGPVSLAVGDVSGDGLADLVTANSVGGNVSVLYNNGTRDFPAAASYGSLAQPASVVLADFDGDSVLDLAVADQGSDRVAVFLGSMGGFSLAGEHAVGSDPVSVAAADVDGDGSPDLAVANQGSGTVSVLVNSGAGDFGAASSHTVGSSPRSVALGDLNGDGVPDLVAANQGSNSLSVLMNSGAGGFLPAAGYVVGNGPRSVALVDLNEDGAADVVAANAGAATVSVLINSGPGAFVAPVHYDVGAEPVSIAAADSNGDGTIDIAVANRADDDVSVLLNSGTGKLARPAVFAAGAQPRALAIGDLNSDGVPDLVVARATDVASVLLGSGAGTFAAAVHYPVGVNPSSAALADLDGDGRLDIVVANSGPSTGTEPDSISVLLNQGAGTFAAAVHYGAGDRPISVAAGDLDGDGDPDVVVANESASLMVFRNTGGTLALAATLTVAVRGLALGDLDGDLDLDIAVVGSGAAVVPNLFVENGVLEFGPPDVWYPVGDAPWSVTVADLNADDRLDLVVPNFYSASVSVLLHAGTGRQLSPAVSYPVGSQPMSAATGDLDDDGSVDVVVANAYSNDLSVLHNAGAPAIGTFDPATRYAAGGAMPYSVRIADLNGDGALDVAAANYDSGTVAVHRGFRGHSVHAHAASSFELEGTIRFEVHLAGPAAAAVTVGYQTFPVTATQGGDYTQVAGTLTFLPGDTVEQVVVPIAGDGVDEVDETFALRLTPPWNVLVAEADAIGTILDDDPGGVVEIVDDAPYTATESAGTVAIGIRRIGPLTSSASVDYMTIAGTASAGADFTPTSGRLTFAPGQSSATVSVPILADGLDEGPERLTFRLANPSPGARLGSPRDTQVTIVDSNNTLVVTLSGSGAGAVVSDPTGISCGADCSEGYASGTAVTLTAAPAVGVAFGSWTGDCSGTLPTCALTMSANRAAVAAFNCAPIVAPASRIHPSARSEGNTIAVSTSGGCSWGAVVTDPSVTWIAITGGTVGAGNGTIVYTVEENTDEVERTATINAAGRLFTLTQYPPQVASATSITSLSSSATLVGQPITVAFDVASSLGPGVTPAGSVSVGDGLDSCTGALSAGAGSCSFVPSTAGTKSLVASYLGDPRHLQSSSAPAALAVGTTPTTTTITGDDPDASFVGQPVVMSFVVEPQAPGGGSPTGTVTVQAGAQSCARTLLAADGGVGSCTIELDSPGPRSLVATYAPSTPLPGDPVAHAGSVSATVAHDVVTSAIETTADVVALDGFCSLREAVQAANANGVVNECGYQSYTIGVPPTSLATPAAFVLASPLPPVTASLTLAGAGAPQVTIDGGDAVRLFEVAPSGRLTLSGLTLTGGRADDGGAILSEGTLAITDAVLDGNQATGYGGAVLSYGPLTVQGTTFSSNAAGEGGALDIEYGTATVTRSTFSGNTAESVAGAIWNGGALTLSSVTVASNAAPAASALYSRSAATVRSSILAGSCVGGVTDGGHNLGSGSSCGLTAPSSQPNVDPLLSGLSGNGGETPTHALQAGSPAINAGHAAACAEAPPSGAGGRDQRGVAHVDTCDIGAYETPFATTATALASSGATVFGQPVTLTATVSGATPPTGTVAFRAGATTLGSAALDGSGDAVFVTASLPAGAHALTAKYLGDGFHALSTSSPITHVVSRAGTTTVLAQSAAASVHGGTVTLTGTVSAVPPGQGSPSGSVVFRDGSTTLGSAPLAGGVASFSLVRPAVGAHTLSAEYAGDAGFTASVSTAIQHVVSAKPVVPQSVWHAWFAVDTLETPYVGDFNGDGMTDIITFTRQNPAAVGDVYVSVSNGQQFLSQAGVPNGSDKWHDWFAISTDETVVVGDYDGDGRDDVATWLGKTSRQVYVAPSTGSGMAPAAVWLGSIGSDPSDVLLAGDANGDGRDDLVCFARSQGRVLVALSQGTGFQAPAEWHAWFAVSTYERPRVADVNGDGRADIVTFATDSPTARGDVYVALSNGSRFQDANGTPNGSTKWHDWFAISQDQQVRIGDVDADARDDFFTFLPSPFAQCYTVRSEGTGMGPNELWPESVAPLATDVPYVGDVDGDGKADVIVFAQSEGKVYVSLAR